jgi:formylglycine-generating enzyme required for sulfatase activity
MLSDEYYRLFGLERNASSKDIKIIYRKLVKRFHPDSLEQGASHEEIKSAEEYFKRMQEAYEAIYSDALNRENSQGNREREELERRQREEKEAAKKKDDEERLKRQREETARLKREQNERKHEEKSSGGKWFFGAFIFFAVLALGWYGTQDSGNPKESVNPVPISTPTATAPQKTTPSVTATPLQTAKISASPIVPAADQKMYTNSIGMEFVLIRAGEFDMGSTLNDESPVHRVNISSVFYMGKYEVKEKQWRDVMGSSPSYFKGDNLPVEQVSWNDIQDFIKKLNDKEGGDKYRLPTEAEWEYPARAGRTARYSFGDDESIIRDYSWYDVNSGSKTHEVGQKKPNSWGLYDMHGNVWEWVQDIYHDSYSGAPIDGSAWEGSGSKRVVRGCSWVSNAEGCRSAIRFGYDPGSRISYLGFRLLRDV